MKSVVVFCLLGLAVFFLSCQNGGVESNVKKMLDNKISLDLSKMERISFDQSDSSGMSRFVLICYYDSTECQSCATNKLHTWNNFMKKYSRKNQLSYLFVFSPAKNTYRYLHTFLECKKQDKNIFIDSLAVFGGSNPFIPPSPLYHTMLVDNKTKEIKMVGDPRRDKKLEFLFNNIINKAE